MTATVPMIRRADPYDMDSACEVLAEAFAEGPVAEWVLRDPTARLFLYREYARAGYPRALVEGEVWITDDYSAVAIWYRIGGPRDLPPAEAQALADAQQLAEQALAKMAAHWPDDAIDRLGILDHEIARRHPNAAHWHLAFLGVRPDAQGRGIGSTMLAHHHALTDSEGDTSWLVATSDRSRALYERHGYELLEMFDFDGSPPLYSMRRKPRAG